MVEIQQRPIRKSGFDCPWHPTQIFTYILFVLDVVSYYSIDMVCLSAYNSSNIIIALYTVFTLIMIATTYYGYLATKCNPTDPTIQLEIDCKHNNI